MNLIYQGIPGAYSNIACLKIKDLIKGEIHEINGFANFNSVWENIDYNNIGVIPIENSYAGNIHENLYNFIRYEHIVIGELNLEVDHCLLSKETDIKNIKEVFSHPQALSQCHNYLKKHNIKATSFGDTARAANMIKNSNKDGIGAIASDMAGDIYGLNIIDEAIQDQNGNTTRFLVVAPKETKIEFLNKKKKTSILFEAKNIPASLYKCLGAFATNNVNLSKIESLPSLKDPFTYLFWLDFEGITSDENVIKSLEELKFFTNNIKILGEY